MLKNNGFHNRHSPILRAFSPASLFSSGAPGAWYDPSDYGATGTLFQDSAGTTPVTAVEQPVGLMLDKSQGLVLGVELLNNGDFSQGTTGWTLGASAAITGGALVITSAPQFEYVATSSPSIGTAGKFYSYTFTISNYSAGSIGVYFYNNTGHVFSANGTYTVIVQKTDVGGIRLRSQSSTAFTGTIDNISVKELAGNHAFQSTSASRPVLSARYNLLTKTEQFDDAVWVKSNLTISANEITAPDGTLTADKLVETIANGFHTVYQSATTASQLSYSYTNKYKAGGRDWIAIQISDATASVYYNRYFNITTGVAGTTTATAGTTATSYSITPLADGWYEITISASFTAALATTRSTVFIATADGTVSYAGDITKGIYIWGASLVPSNQSTLPYQRVNTSTDYATTGFLPYLKFDGVDDSLSTNSISFTSTDKMSVFAGVRKLSDAAIGMVAELSGDSNSNNGTFFVAAPVGATTGNYGVKVRGNIAALAAGYAPATYTSPITNVVDASLDLSGSTRAQVIIPRINGVVRQGDPDANTLNNGGNFGNYPLFIGRRNNASLPFNGQLYSMIIVGKAVTAGELSSTETYVNQKTGAYA